MAQFNCDLNALSSAEKLLARTKFGLLATGAQVTDMAWSAIQRRGKNPMRTRSGVSGGLDVSLGNDVFVNVPVEGGLVENSPFLIDSENGSFLLRSAGEVLSIDVLNEPSFYNQTDPTSGRLLNQVGQMCSGDRFCYGMTGPSCAFWKKDRRCQYCSIGVAANPDLSKKTIAEFQFAFKQAVSDPIAPAKHLLIGGGTPPGDDMGAIMAAKLTRAAKEIAPEVSVYVMIAAPKDNDFLDELIASGVDEIGLNLEFWSDEAWARYIPGKNAIIGKQRYLQALEYIFSRIGPIRTRSILIAGIEPAAQTIQAVSILSSMGIMPIISPFRPLVGSELENHDTFDVDQYWALFESSVAICEENRVPLGPTCVYCQNNTLALPFGNAFRRY